MADRPRTAGSIDQHQAADGGYFAPLAAVKYVRLTTFKRDGMPASACVHGVVDGDRGYFGAWSRSGTVKRLRHTEAVLVTPCSVLGFCSYGRPLGAVARQLQGEEASHVAAKLDRKYPVRRRFLIRLLRRQAIYYELLDDDEAGDQGGVRRRPRASLITRVHTRQGFMHAGAGTPTSLATVCRPSMMSRSRPSGYTQITTISMSLPAPRPAAEAQQDHGAALGHIP
jgi:PPOX class probable F420-dependent enzyme